MLKLFPRARLMASPFLVLPILLLLASQAQAGELIFADILNPGDPLGNSIRHINTDGSGLETLIQTGGGLRGLDVDPASGLIYWTDTDNFVIRRAHMDGSGQQDLVSSNLGFPSAIRLDSGAGKMYWGDQSNGEIHRADLTGANDELLASTNFNRGIALDTVHGKMYWTTSVTAATGRIISADLDGSNSQIVVSSAASAFKPTNLALDVAGGKVYWTDAVTDFVRRSNLDGSDIETLFNANALGSPKGITLDLASGKVYWGQDVNDPDSGGFMFGAIYRMNLDGSSPESVATGLGSVNDLNFVVPAPESLPILLGCIGVMARRRRR